MSMTDIRIDFTNRQVRIADRLIYLTKTEFLLFNHLYLNRGNAVRYDVLLAVVWGEEYKGELKYLHDYIHFLRLKIEPDPSKPMYIVNIRDYGYKLVLPD